MLFGSNGRSVSGNVVLSSAADHENVRNMAKIVSTPTATTNDEDHPVKVSHAEITLKSATLPRRKTSRSDNLKFDDSEETATSSKVNTQSAPIQPQYKSRYSPVYQQQQFQNRATSLEPQKQRPKEYYIPIQQATGSYVTNTGTMAKQRSLDTPLSRQSTNDDSESSEIQTVTSTETSANQAIKKSPREFIIPIAMEGGGYITPRATSLEPSDSNHSNSKMFSRFSGHPR